MQRRRSFPFQAREAWTFPSTPSASPLILICGPLGTPTRSAARHRRRSHRYAVQAAEVGNNSVAIIDARQGKKQQASNQRSARCSVQIATAGKSIAQRRFRYSLFAVRQSRSAGCPVPACRWLERESIPWDRKEVLRGVKQQQVPRLRCTPLGMTGCWEQHVE